jgi:hypothetical protein
MRGRCGQRQLCHCGWRHDPQQSRAILLDLVDQGQILVALGVLDLIDADRLDAAQIAMLQPPLHRILDRSEATAIGRQDSSPLANYRPVNPGRFFWTARRSPSEWSL